MLVVHLGMSGQLLRAKGPKDPLDKHTHVIITFTQGGQLRFVDPRTFGEMFVTTTDELTAQVPELAHLGFDPLEDVMSWSRFGQLLAERPTALKTLLMDQKFVAGIGNIYSDEILFAAGLRYDRQSDSLSAQEIRRLYRAMVETLTEAVKHRGSSLADEQYRDLYGAIGDYQGQHQVYDREGQACRRCRNADGEGEGQRPLGVLLRALPDLIAGPTARSAVDAARSLTCAVRHVRADALGRRHGYHRFAEADR